MNKFVNAAIQSACFGSMALLLCPWGCPLLAQINIHFDELTPPQQNDGNQYFDGYGASAMAGEWSSQGVSFNTNMFGPGFSYSNVDDVSTPGFLNQWAAITGADVSGFGNYALANSLSDNGAVINLPADRLADSIFITNSTYSFLSMQSGDSFAKQFGGEDGNDPDFFLVKLQGFAEQDAEGNLTGEVVFCLADFRFADNAMDYILDDWEWVDLSDLGEARSIGISFESSDVGEFGINTPVYVALDELVLRSPFLLGDVNRDGSVNLLDVAPFVDLLIDGRYQIEADINEDGQVDLLDVAPFVDLVSI